MTRLSNCPFCRMEVEIEFYEKNKSVTVYHTKMDRKTYMNKRIETECLISSDIKFKAMSMQEFISKWNWDSI